MSHVHVGWMEIAPRSLGLESGSNISPNSEQSGAGSRPAAGDDREVLRRSPDGSSQCGLTDGSRNPIWRLLWAPFTSTSVIVEEWRFAPLRNTDRVA